MNPAEQVSQPPRGALPSDTNSGYSMCKSGLCPGLSCIRARKRVTLTQLVPLGLSGPCCYFHSLPCTWGPDMTRGTLYSVWLTRQESRLVFAPGTPLSGPALQQPSALLCWPCQTGSCNLLCTLGAIAWGDTTSLKEMSSLCLVIILPVWDKAQPCSSAQHPLRVQSQPKHSQCCKSLSLWPCPGVSGCLLLYLMLPALAQPGSGWGHPCLWLAPGPPAGRCANPALVSG